MSKLFGEIVVSMYIKEINIHKLILFLEDSQLSAYTIQRVPSYYPFPHTIKRLCIPNNVEGIPVTSIYSNAFNDIKSLEYVTIPNTIKNIYDRAFNGCSNLKVLIIPGSLKEIGFCFQSCESLKTIKFKEGVETITSGAFRDCENIKKIFFPKSIKFIHDDAFLEAKSIQIIIANDNEEAIAFAKKRNIKYI